MIVMNPGVPVATPAGPELSDITAWQCLVRRGMLHSETEGIEHWQLPAGGTLEVRARHGVDEAVLVLSGSVRLVTSDREETLLCGHIALLPHGTEGSLHTQEPATVLTIRCLASAVATALPARVPELLSNES
ncbi:hypothetical protein [Streptomyces sp. NPDC047046]|uniref:hypothetical protein n=1 Tax=Streptomyces sp. NPDC047046 TaxID=3155378 RepID=UPI00340C0EBE